jgi:hypothetical protein
MRKLKPQEVPPLVYQALSLCRQKHSGKLLAAIDKYYTNQLAAALDPCESEDLITGINFVFKNISPLYIV